MPHFSICHRLVHIMFANKKNKQNDHILMNWTTANPCKCSYNPHVHIQSLISHCSCTAEEYQQLQHDQCSIAFINKEGSLCLLHALCSSIHRGIDELMLTERANGLKKKYGFHKAHYFIAPFLRHNNINNVFFHNNN